MGYNHKRGEPMGLRGRTLDKDAAMLKEHQWNMVIDTKVRAYKDGGIVPSETGGTCNLDSNKLLDDHLMDKFYEAGIIERSNPIC